MSRLEFITRQRARLLREARSRLLKALYGFLAALFLAFFLGKPVLQIIAKPVEDRLLDFYEPRQWQCSPMICPHCGRPQILLQAAAPEADSRPRLQP